MNITEELNNLKNELIEVSAIPAERFKPIQIPEPIAYLRHDATHTNISVYKKIPKIQRFFIKWLFGLEYKEKI